MIIQQILMNKYFGKFSDQELLQASMERTNKKRAKKGLPPIDEKSVEKRIEKAKAMANTAEENRMAVIAKQNAKTKESTEYYNRNAAPGSLASKANMVQMYDEKNEKNKK